MGGRRLDRTLWSHLQTVHETLQVLELEPASSVRKVTWDEVVKMGDQVSHQATTAGLLWNGGALEVKALEENMAAYFNVLQGFLLLSHGSRVGAGPTLSSNIQSSVRRVFDSSCSLFKGAVSSYGSHKKAGSLSVPQLVGTVWEACSDLKKTPSTNIRAVGRALVEVAVLVKDALRELRQLELAPADSTADDASDDNNSTFSDLGKDLTLEEMKIAQLVISVVSEVIVVLKELIRSITGLAKQENANDDSKIVSSLERLLKLCLEADVQVDEMAAGAYPAQDLTAMKNASEEISTIIDKMLIEVESIKCPSESLSHACDSLRSSLRQLESGIDCSGIADLLPMLQNVAISS